MSQNHARGIDLSALPPEVRQKVEAGLARLPPEVRQQWLEHGSPLLRKLVASAGGRGQAHARKPQAPPALPAALRPGPDGKPPSLAEVAKAVSAAHRNHRSAPHGHYNDTIRPGDSPQAMRWLMIVLGIAALAVVFWE